MLIGAFRSRFFHASVSRSSDSNGPEMMSDGGRCKLPKYLNTHVRSTGVILYNDSLLMSHIFDKN